MLAKVKMDFLFRLGSAEIRGQTSRALVCRTFQSGLIGLAGIEFAT